MFDPPTSWDAAALKRTHCSRPYACRVRSLILTVAMTASECCIDPWRQPGFLKVARCEDRQAEAGNAPLRYFSALFSRLVLFFNCLLSASTCFVRSISSCLATCVARAAFNSCFVSGAINLTDCRANFSPRHLRLFFAMSFPPARLNDGDSPAGSKAKSRKVVPAQPVDATPSGLNVLF